MIWTHNRSLGGQQGISSPVSLLTGLLGGLFSHLRKRLIERGAYVLRVLVTSEAVPRDIFFLFFSPLIDEKFPNTMGEYVT